MSSFFQNRILRLGVMGTFIFLLFFAPLSSIITPHVNAEVGATGGASYGPAVDNANVQPKGDTDPESTLGKLIGNMIIQFAASLTGVGGRLLDYTIKKLVLEMGSLVKEPNIKKAIDDSWKIIRDIANLAFIFGFIYIGISTIIDANRADTKRFLSQIIIGALLINFSLLITKLVIDFSNLTAVEIYNAMVIESPGAAANNSLIAAKFADVLGIITYYNVSGPGKNEVLAGMTNAGGIWFFLLGSIFFLVAAFVFAAGAVLLVIRFVALLLIMIFSPILFAATVFPKTSHLSQDLWRKLFSYSFFAPAYLLLLLLSLKVLLGLRTALTPNPDLAAGLMNINVGNQDNFLVVMTFVIAIMFLIMSLKAAQQFGVKGADKVMGIGSDLRNRGQRYLGNATFGVAGAAGRNIVGRGANRIAESDRMREWASRSKLGKFAIKTTRGVADSSFDARKVGGVGKKLGIGEGSKGGFTTSVKEKVKKEKDFAKSLGHNQGRVDVIKESGERNIETAKKQANVARDQMRAATQVQREDLINEARRGRSAATEEERRASTARVNAIKAEIETIERPFRERIEVAEAQEKNAKARMDDAIKNEKGRRATAYANKLANKWGFGNKKAAKEIKDAAGKDPDKTDELREAFESLRKDVKKDEH